MREIRLTAGRLQVRISFPSASLLIKQLNGLKKVVLRVKTVKEERHRHTHSMYLNLILSYSTWLTDIPTI